MRKAHLHALTLIAGSGEGFGRHLSPGDVASVLMDVAHDAAGGHVGAALRPERAGPAVAEAGVVADRVICADAAGRRQHLAGRQV